MSKKGKLKTAGPYVAAAVFCEKVLIEADNVVSAIRIIDMVTVQNIVQYVGPETKGDMASVDGASPMASDSPKPSPAEVAIEKLKSSAPLGSGLQILIVLKSGDYSGTGVVTIKAFKPSGVPIKSKESTSVDVELKGENFGANLVINMGLAFEENGVHWFEVHFEDRILTRMPLLVVVSQPTTDNGAPT